MTALGVRNIGTERCPKENGCDLHIDVLSFPTPVLTGSGRRDSLSYFACAKWHPDKKDWQSSKVQRACKATFFTVFYPDNAK
jgi:hypothetical protein